MPPLATRDGTWDMEIVTSVLGRNEYRLNRLFGPGDVVLDLGAHVGSFAALCLQRGAGRVVCAEACPNNFALLRYNLHDALGYGPDRVACLNVAAWDRDAALRMAHCPGGNTGAGTVVGPTAGPEAGPTAVRAVPADSLIHAAAGDGPLALLKIDIEQAERVVLPAVTRWGQVRWVVGELHLQDPAWLDGVLGPHGFRTAYRELVKSIGLFAAWRDGDAPVSDL